MSFAGDRLKLADWLTWGAFSYPIAFLVTDLTNRAYGPAAARKVVLVGFALAVILSLIFAEPRIALASGTAFLVAQFMDVLVFDKLRQSNWWKAPLFSSLIGSALDTALFFSLGLCRDRPALDELGIWRFLRQAGDGRPMLGDFPGGHGQNRPGSAS